MESLTTITVAKKPAKTRREVAFEMVHAKAPRRAIVHVTGLSLEKVQAIWDIVHGPTNTKEVV